MRHFEEFWEVLGEEFWVRHFEEGRLWAVLEVGEHQARRDRVSAMDHA